MSTTGLNRFLGVFLLILLLTRLVPGEILSNLHQHEHTVHLNSFPLKHYFDNLHKHCDDQQLYLGLFLSDLDECSFLANRAGAVLNSLFRQIYLVRIILGSAQRAPPLY